MKYSIIGFRSTLSFFDPNIKTDKGRLWKQERYDEILEEQVLISYAAKGISITDTDELTPYDRNIILQSIMKIKDQEAKAQQQA